MVLASVAVFERWKPAAFIVERGERASRESGSRVEGDGDKGVHPGQKDGAGPVILLADVAIGTGTGGP